MAVDEVRRRVKQVVEANKGEAFGVLMKKCVVAVEGGYFAFTPETLFYPKPRRPMSLNRSVLKC
jgi:hypothetical protein